MAALLVGLAVMSVVLSVAMPVWSQMARREKEAELIFRGEQYKRALDLFQRRNGPGVAPPSVDVLVEQRFLRKAFKDPITGEDFLLIRQSQQAPGPGRGRGPGPGRGGPAPPVTTPAPATAPQLPGRGGGFAAGGIVGVASTSTEESLRIYNGRSRYNEWDFTFVQQAQAPGGGAPGVGGPGVGTPGVVPGRGGPGAAPGAGPPGIGGRGRGGEGQTPPDTGRGRSPFPPFDGRGQGRGVPVPQQPPR